MGSKQATKEQRNRSLAFAIAEMEKKDAKGKPLKSSGKVAAELKSLAESDPSYFPFTAATLRDYLAQWKRGELPEIDPVKPSLTEKDPKQLRSTESEIPVQLDTTENISEQLTDDEPEPQVSIEPGLLEISPSISDDKPGSTETCPETLRSFSEDSIYALPGTTDNIPAQPGYTQTTSDIEVLKRIMNDITVEEREWTGPGKKGTGALKQIGAKLPAALVDEMKSLKRPLTHHVERALKLYLKALKAET